MGRFISLIALLLGCVLALPAIGRARFTTYSEARDLLTPLAEVLPAELKAAHDASSNTGWSSWIAAHDRDIRQRLRRGDDDTIVNWLRLGTSFTDRPRAIADDPANPAKLAELIAARTHDLVTALAAGTTDERRLFARRSLEAEGYRFDTSADRAHVEEHLAAEVLRVARENQGFARELDAARRIGDTSEDFAARSKLFRDRGLSLDTSILPSFALERALQRMMEQQVLGPTPVRRAAVIGPGLDFADKGSGYDFYPQQTLQPFALADSLMRLGLTDPATGVQITTFDISPRVNDHLTRVRARARNGSPYVVRLPLDSRIAWTPGVLEYWKRMGDRIGAEARDAKPAADRSGVEFRTLRIRPQMALRVVPEDLNVVTQRFDGQAFDLVVATNIFVYYDTLDQSLALANVAAMLRPGGLLLSNNALLELPASPIRSAGYLTVVYSDRPDDGDHIVWYRRLP
jgi:hypothetical protein